MSGFIVRISNDRDQHWRPTLPVAEAFMRQKMRGSPDGTVAEILSGDSVVKRFVARAGVARVEASGGGDPKEPWYAPRLCPVCLRTVNRNRAGNLSEHTEDIRLPRRKGSDIDAKIERRRCAGSGCYSAIKPTPSVLTPHTSTKRGLNK